MKKLFYILLIVVSTSLAITSCTEEDVAPKGEACNGGGGALDHP